MQAPLSAFRNYGNDCYFYALHIHEGAVVAVLAGFIASFPMMYNLLHEQTRREVIFYSQTSLFAGCPLSWLHIICDCLYTVLIAGYCVRWQRQLMTAEASTDRAVQSASEVVEACSVVILDHHQRDWTNGDAQHELETITRAAGSPPIALSQAHASAAMLRLRRRLNQLELKRPWLVALELAKQQGQQGQQQQQGPQQQGQQQDQHEGQKGQQGQQHDGGDEELAASLDADAVPPIHNPCLPRTWLGRLRMQICEILEGGDFKTLAALDAELEDCRVRMERCASGRTCCPSSSSRLPTPTRRDAWSRRVSRRRQSGRSAASSATQGCSHRRRAAKEVRMSSSNRR